MFDTYVTIVGNALNTPEWRRTANTGAVVVSFKVASTARRLNRETGQWVDGNSLRVRVTCWRRLAEGVGASVKSGDPVVVVGRLFTREWEDENGARRLAYEVEAVAIGHDLSKGRAQFARVKPALGTSMVEDADADARIGGEATAAMSPDEVPVPAAVDLHDVEDADGDWAGSLDSLRAGGLDPLRLDGAAGLAEDGMARLAEDGAAGLAEDGAAGLAEDGMAGLTDPEIGEEPTAGEPARRRRGRGREPVPA